VGGSIVRLYDPQVHQSVEADPSAGKVDRRWIHVRRPFIIAGGEMTMEELDLAFSPSLRFYEAPPHVKANGGTFMVDDFGRQRIDPHDLLNRWIIPLESRIDHLTLHTGQKIQIPFELMLIVATNLRVSDVADPAFLRRMGYRLHIDYPTPENYRRIFERYADGLGVSIRKGLLETLLERYAKEERMLRASEPRDLIERARDTCLLRHQPLELNQEVLDVAWRGYFGNAPK
jgi:predicted ATPase with chaperone activity